MLCDTGPLVALIDADDSDHEQCKTALAGLPVSPLTVTWPCLTEAMHFAYRVGGIEAQNELWSYVADGILRLYLSVEGECDQMQALMNQYADMPLDIADASLITAAERLNDYQLFSLDKPLRAVRLLNGKFFEVVP
jgi:uncharacterized protein